MSKHRLAFSFPFPARPPLFIRQHPRVFTNPPLRANLSSSARRRLPEAATQRYGTANEPPLHLTGGKKGSPPATSPPQNTSGVAEQQRRIGPPPQQQSTRAEHEKETVSTKGRDDSEALREDETSNKEEQDGNNGPSTSTEQKRTIPAGSEDLPYSSSQSALHAIMSMDSPTSEESPAEKPPHLQTPPYVHHFDTFTLVRNLQEGGFSEEEAVNLMKVVRTILADNMDLARAGILSKSDGEMSDYLFGSACSELRTEIRNNRALLTERMRTERTNLQHEVDILSQRITADAASLKDELKGMFDDRKMAVRMERRDIENRIQELNYAITSQLNSEMKSEVEGLRWVLVKRTAMALVVVAITALLTLRIAKAGEKRKGGAGAASVIASSSALNGTNSVAASGERILGNGENPELVSLG